MTSKGKLFKANYPYKPKTSVVIGGADLSDLPNKQEIIQKHLLEARLNAQRQSEKITDEAQVKVKEIIEKAQESAQGISITAYEEGFKAGKQEALQIVQAEFKSIIENAHLVLENIKKECHECLEDEEEKIYKVIVLIAKVLLKRDLSINPQMSIEFISQAIKKLDSKLDIRVHLDTATALCLQEAKEHLIIDNQGLESLNLIADSKLKPGDLILESNSERLDFTLETQLDELAKEIIF